MKALSFAAACLIAAATCSSAATVGTAAPNESVSAIEATTGASGLDALLSGFTLTTGNVVSFGVDGFAGGVFSFQYEFASNEIGNSGIFRDAAFAVFDGMATLLASSDNAPSSGQFDVTLAGDGPATVYFGALNGTSLTIPPIPDFPLEAFDNEASVLEVALVPLPTSVFFLLAGIGGLGLLRLRGAG